MLPIVDGRYVSFLGGTWRWVRYALAGPCTLLPSTSWTLPHSPLPFPNPPVMNERASLWEGRGSAVWFYTHVISCYRAMSYPVVSCRVVPQRFVSCRTPSFRIVSYPVVLCRVVPRRFVSCRAVPHHCRLVLSSYLPGGNASS